ncbi:transposase, partial [Intestinimonas butyriciproducens]
GSIYYRWFLGYTLQEETPHFSTVSYNFRHRFTEETVQSPCSMVEMAAGSELQARTAA